ncbi:MAG: GntR family transcriptional regulator [Anaerolineae bacterium]
MVSKPLSEAPQLEPISVLNLRNHIEDRVRAAILSGGFRPGDRLVESFLAEQLGVSRAPVREALSALERAGIVVSVPRRGYFVVDFSDKDIEEIYSLRLLLEVGALRRAVGRVTEEGLEEMQRVVDQLAESALRLDAPEETVALDLSFHELVCRAADHSRLHSAWDSLRMQNQLLISVTARTHYTHPDQPGKLHQRILDAIRERDLARAEAILTEHMADAERRARMALWGLRSSGLEESE